MQRQLSQDELAFIERMRVHIEAGKGLEDAARAVLADDIRLLEFLTKQPEDGEFRACFSATVYWRLKAKFWIDGAPMTGYDLKAARNQLGLGVDALARAMRLGSDGGRTVRRWEEGERPVPGWAAFIIGLLLSREWPEDWPAAPKGRIAK
mgnify:CR=1 FL=1